MYFLNSKRKKKKPVIVSILLSASNKEEENKRIGKIIQNSYFLSKNLKRLKF